MSAPNDVRWNFGLNVLDGAVFAFGLSFVSRVAVLPVFVKRIGGDNVAVGLIPVLWILGFNLPQLLIVRRAQVPGPKKTLLLKTALLQRIPWLLIGLLGMTLVHLPNPGIALSLFFLGFALAAIGGSVNLPVWFDLIARLTPVAIRGRLFALRTVLGAALALLGGVIVEVVLEGVPYPSNFAALFGLGFATMMVSYIFLALLREGRPAPFDVHNAALPFLRQLPTIVRSNSNFRNFIIAEALIVTVTTAEGFFAVDAFQKFGLSPGFAGRFTAIGASGVFVGNLVFGFVADRFGHKSTLVLSGFLMSTACGLALLAPSVEVYYAVFVLAALTVALRAISQLPFIAELCAEQNRPTHVALVNVLTTPFILFGLLAGWLANVAGYNAVFTAALTVGLVSSLWLAIMVREPRRITARKNQLSHG